MRLVVVDVVVVVLGVVVVVGDGCNFKQNIFKKIFSLNARRPENKRKINFNTQQS